MLNSIINIDLHIHSNASKYKEEESIVRESTKENLDVLFSKLQEHNINLFSITDHNRFDSDLYIEAKKIIKAEKYSNVKGLLAGVEFDVKLEDSKKSCHIITIFNANNIDDYKKIEEMINNNKLIKKDDSYSKEEFENLLKSIKLDTILIANQRKDIENIAGYHKSLNDATDSPYEYLKIGYINALEYQKPNVQGILKHNLKDFPKNIALITGSDCHEWSAYPKRDSSEESEQKKYFSKIKMLPTFKGLLMAFTSPETRFDRKNVENANFLDKITINDIDILFDSGINAIIGENGSGKSTLYKSIIGDNSKAHVKELISKNSIKHPNIKMSDVTKVGQSEIIDKFKDNKLFEKDSELFNSIDHSLFESRINKYSENLKKYIEKNISTSDIRNNLENHSIIINPNNEDSTYYIDININSEFSSKKNPHQERRGALKDIIRILKDEHNMTEYYKDNEIETLKNVLENISRLYSEVNRKSEMIEIDKKIASFIVKHTENYKSIIHDNSTSDDNEKANYNLQKNELRNAILSLIKSESQNNEQPIFPNKIEGVSTNTKNGFEFQKEARYNNLYLENKFIEDMFVKDFHKLDKIYSIDSHDIFANAIKGANIENFSKKWSDNVSKFINDHKKETSYIKEVSSKTKTGNTLGEFSITFYKYHTNVQNKWKILIIDQPEDNISNNRISSELIRYFNKLRTRDKQIIFITHSPLLVVNLDVDNVIYLENNSGVIKTKSGCLEDEKNKILELIAENMDGGKDSIEKRLNIYG